jgi:hypothetical protein
MLICGVRHVITGYRADQGVVADGGIIGATIAVRRFVGRKRDDGKGSE